MSFLSGPDVSALCNTHNTSLACEHADLAEFNKQLDLAVESAWPARHKEYSKVSVLMMSWEVLRGQDDLRHEMALLRAVFEHIYKYSVEEWSIPLVAPERPTERRIRDAVWGNSGPGTLLIVYYAGYATPSPYKNRYPIWQSNPSDKHAHRLDTTTIHDYYLCDPDKDSSDILLLYDCCFAFPPPLPKPTDAGAEFESLSAGAFDTTRVPALEPGAFTRQLREELATAAGGCESLTVIDLHARLLSRLHSSQQAAAPQEHELQTCLTNLQVIPSRPVREIPTHMFFAGSAQPRTLSLSPLRTNSGESRVISTLGPSEDERRLKVLLSVRTEVKRKIQEWIGDAPPNDVVRCFGTVESQSTLRFIAVPVVVWDMLPDNPAVSFVGFLNGGTLQSTRAIPSSMNFLEYWMSKSHLSD